MNKSNESAHLITITAMSPDKVYLVKEITARIKLALPDVYQIGDGIFILEDAVRFNKAQQAFMEFIMDKHEVEYFAFRIVSPVAGSFLAERQTTLAKMGLEPNNMIPLETRKGAR